MFRQLTILIAAFILVIASGHAIAQDGLNLDLPSTERVDAEAGEQATSVSLFEAFFIQRHPVTRKIELLGSMIIWFLLILSMASLGYLGVMASEVRSSKIMPSESVDQLRNLVREGKAKHSASLASQDPSYFGRTVAAALTELDHGYVAMLRAGEQAADELAMQRLRRIEPLAIAGNVAPMIGLFGTVYGMILAFREIVAAGGTPDPVGLASGIGTALTTTFWGLVVAIPALTGHAFLRNAIDERTVRAARIAEEIIASLRPDPTEVFIDQPKPVNANGKRGRRKAN